MRFSARIDKGCKQRLALRQLSMALLFPINCRNKYGSQLGNGERRELANAIRPQTGVLIMHFFLAEARRLHKSKVRGAVLARAANSDCVGLFD